MYNPNGLTYNMVCFQKKTLQYGFITVFKVNPNTMIGILKAPDIYLCHMSVYLHINYLAWCGSLFGLITYAYPCTVCVTYGLSILWWLISLLLSPCNIFLVISNGYLHLSTFCAALQVLDFDFEKFCSISLSNLNVYACLVCGKYFQGRGLKSHAYTHSLEAGHHVFINLQTERAYCLPDGYEINDPSLEDIRHVLNPRCFSITYKL